ncbi:MAG: T9SS type A sorting domain-containing protein, partial [Bacteroidota bacterium]
IIEGQSTAGYTAPANQDLDKDGIDDAYDVDYAPTGYIVPHDLEGDNTPDYRDLDTDNDGKSDPLEGYDTDGDGTAEIVALGQDSDGDGLDDAFDKDNNSLTDTFGADNTDTPSSFPPSNTVANERAWRAVGGGNFPVEWLDFQAVWQGSNAEISWATASEISSDYFAIERSLDGQAFHEMGKVQAAGNASSVSQYAFTDENAAELKLTKYFYRLRQVDQNGEFEYSNTIELDLSLREGDISLAAYPNPAQDMIEIRYAAFQAGNLELRIFNSIGQLVHEQNIRYDKGNQFQSLDISNWTPGMYVIELASENYASSLKIVKQ